MLYGNKHLALVVETDNGWELAGRSDIELHPIKKAIETIPREFPVIYLGSDINKIARFEEKSYRDELKKFVRVFTDDKGKNYYILK